MQEIGRGPVGVPAGLAQRAVDASDQEESHADRSHLAVRAVFVEPVGVDHGISRRQRRFAEVMIDDDDIEALVSGGFEGAMRGDTAIDGDDDARALRPQFCQCRCVWAIAFALPVGHVDNRVRADRDEEALKQRGRGRAIDVVIAEDRDGLAVADCSDEAFDRAIHIAKMRRIRQTVAQGGREKPLAVVFADAAARQEPPDDFGKAETLR